MLNLVNLAIISMLSMGMAYNVMPFGHTENTNEFTLKQPKKQNIVNNYTLTLGYTTRNSQTFQNQPVSEGVTGKDAESNTNYAASSAYINVIASKYQTITARTINGTEKLYVQNWETWHRFDILYQYVSRLVYVIQINPYNYNLDTETNVELYLNIGSWTDSNGDQIIVTDKYFIKNVYHTTNDDWSGYLNNQITAFKSAAITIDIENIDNGFYYTKTTELIEVTTNRIEDHTSIPLTPDTTNYYVLEYIPCAKANYYDFATDTTTDFGTNVSTIPVEASSFLTNSYGDITISGTNVIPDGTYEVVDIPGLMWEVVTMPFAFVSQAFNLTLFPGTPYQVNISNLFLSIIAIFVFVWLIQFFLKMKG